MHGDIRKPCISFMVYSYTVRQIKKSSTPTAEYVSCFRVQSEDGIDIDWAFIYKTKIIRFVERPANLLWIVDSL